MRGAAAESVPSFDRDIRPILATHCFHCHGPDAGSREADLRLDTESGVRAAVEPENGVAKLIVRVKSHDPDVVMPPPATKKPLRPEQIVLLERWVAGGASWGRHWAFESLEAPPVPTPPTHPFAPVRTPIDAFVQAQLESRGLEPSPEAERHTLLRRVTLDLTGLPPTPEEVDAFVADEAPEAFEKVVNRLLATPAYGERMAWPWLDAARYADSNGYQGDADRTMWPWRDWVIDAFNRNLPYDSFTIWQLAGDQLPEASFTQKLATGFCRNHMINGEGGRIPEENRVEYVMDMAETAGTVWLGLTLNCCRCHDHKFDPLTQRDYYRLFAFFNQTPVSGGGGNPWTPPVLDTATAAQRQQLDELEARLESIEARLKQLAAQPATAADDGSTRERLEAERDTTLEEVDRLRQSAPGVMVMADLPTTRKTFVLDRGLYTSPGVEVTAGVPAALPQLPADSQPNRLAFARWLVADDNPLTARVAVNRFWQQLFGVGLVKTSEDFGVQGELPPHKELVDWMAADFRDHGWDVKRLIRQIVVSHTYRQSSRVTPVLVELDPENRLLARGPRFRLPAPMLRDQALAASGLLVTHLGGPPVNGYQPPGVWEEATFGKKSYPQGHGDDLHRRSLYTFWRRIVAPTMFFDNASRQTCSVKVLRTNTPLHALLTLNDVTFVEAARALAERALLLEGTDDERRLDEIYQRLLARSAAADEQHVLLSAIARSRHEFEGDPEAARQLLSIGESKRDERIALEEHAAWTCLVLAVMNLDEAVTKE
ncbi:MAG: DUF1553 domain-containing protein [Planctomycetia bacterium]